MRTRTNNPPGTGNDGATDFAKAVLDVIYKELQFYDSQTVKFDKTTRGIRAHAANAGNAASTPATGSVWI